MHSGRVKWFNNAKGYGFILPEDGGEDLFAHYSAIQMDGYKTLKAGQEVEYELKPGPKGMHAVNIRALETADEGDVQSVDGADEVDYGDTLSELERAERTRRIADRVRETFAETLGRETSDSHSDG